MKHLKSYKLFESRFAELKEVISTIKDICQEFEDNSCEFKITPENDIHLNIVSLKSRGHIGSISQPFYVEIDVKNIRISLLDRGRKLSQIQLPEWFIENCRRIEDFMSSEGFETLPSVKRTDWEYFDTVDDLQDASGLIHKVKLEFIPNESPKEI